MAVFDHKMKKVFSIFNSIFVDFSATNHILQGKGKAKVSLADKVRNAWKAPPDDFIKLNTDGAWKAINIAGGGGVFRRPSGTWFLGYSSKYHSVSPLAAELEAVREGLIMAEEYEIRKLEVETDVISLKIMLDTMDQNYHHELSPIINDVVGLMTKFEKVEFMHIPRANNTVAHELAAFGMNMLQRKKVHYVVPEFAKDAFERDLNIICPRTGVEDPFPPPGNDGEALENFDSTMVEDMDTSEDQVLVGTIPISIRQSGVGSSSSNAQAGTDAQGHNKDKGKDIMQEK